MLTYLDYCRISFHFTEIISILTSFSHSHEIICAPDEYFSLIDVNESTWNKYFCQICKNKCLRKLHFLELIPILRIKKYYQDFFSIVFV